MKTRRLILALMSAAAFFCTGSVYPSAAEKTEAEIFVSKAESAVNVRSKPSEDSKIIGKLYPGGTGTVLKTKTEGWTRIRSGKVWGYVISDALATGNEAEALMDSAGYRVAQANSSGVSVYYDADETTEVVDSLYEYAYLQVLEEQDEWIQVLTPYGITGWVRPDDVTVSTAYSTAETLKAEEERLEAEEEADSSAAVESELWETAQEALAAVSETKVSLMETQMEKEEIEQAFRESGGDSVSVETLKEAIEKAAAAQEDADRDQKDAEEKVNEAQKASVTAQAAEKVAIEAARLAPRGAEGAEFVTSRDHTIYIETSVGQELVNYACQFVGNPYIWGGESLTDGCDCSGFTMLVYARYGITLPHFAQDQARYGELIENEEDLEPGDLVFFKNSSAYIHHVAIYIGNHSIVHAANSVSGICFSNLHYSSDQLIFRRLLVPGAAVSKETADETEQE